MHDEEGLFDPTQAAIERYYLEMDSDLDSLASFDEFVSNFMDGDEEYGSQLWEFYEVPAEGMDYWTF